MCPQMKISKPVFRNVTTNEIVLAVSAIETYPIYHSDILRTLKEGLYLKPTELGIATETP
jgi:hypothetical protein